MATSILDLDAHLLDRVAEFLHPVYRDRLRSTCRLLHTRIEKVARTTNALDLFCSGIEWRDLHICKAALQLMKYNKQKKAAMKLKQHSHIIPSKLLASILSGSRNPENVAICNLLVDEESRGLIESNSFGIWHEIILHHRDDLMDYAWVRQKQNRTNIEFDMAICVTRSFIDPPQYVYATFSKLIQLFPGSNKLRHKDPIRNYLTHTIGEYLVSMILAPLEFCKFVHDEIISRFGIIDSYQYARMIRSLWLKYSVQIIDKEFFIEHCGMILTWAHTEGYSMESDVILPGVNHYSGRSMSISIIRVLMEIAKTVSSLAASCSFCDSKDQKNISCHKLT